MYNRQVYFPMIRLFLIIPIALLEMSFIKVNQQNKETSGSYFEVLYFHADWCGSCKKFDPTWKKFTTNKSRPNNINLVTVDTASEKELANKFNITSIPALLIVKNNREQALFAPINPFIRVRKSSIPDGTRPWNECELAYFIKEQAVPKEIPCK